MYSNAMETIATQLILNTIMNIHNWCWWITRMVIWGTGLVSAVCQKHDSSRQHMQELQTSTGGRLFVWIIGQFSINHKKTKHSLTSCEIKSQRNTDSKHKENRKTVTWLESGPCFWCSRVTTHSTLSRAMHDSAKMVTVSAPNFGNNLLGQKETVWKQFVIIQPSFLFPLTKVILTIDLSSAWMAFPSVLGCQWCSQTELFNSVRQCCFRPHLWGKAFKLLLYAHSSNTLTQ